MGTVYRPKRSDGKRGDWFIQWRENGKRYKRKIGPIKKEAEMALMDTEKRARLRRSGRAGEDISIDKLLNDFLAYSETNHAPSTTIRYAHSLKRFKGFLRTQRGVRNASQVTPEIVERFKSHRRNTRRRRAFNKDGSEVERLRATTVNFDLRALSICFNTAKKLGYTVDNPVKDTKRLKQNDSRPFRYLSKEECRKLLPQCDDEFRPICQLLIHTGLRRGEIENLEWSDVDLKAGTLKVQAKATWKPKTKGRNIPLSDDALEALRELKRRSSRVDHNYVMVCRTVSTYLPSRLRSASTAAGIEPFSSPHILRHTFASLLRMAGADITEVQELMGHTDISTTMRYAHLAQDHLASAVRRLKLN